EVRSALEESEKEEQEKQEDILSAAGRNYTLLRKGKLGLEYKLEYAYYPYDVIREQNIIEHNSHHNITNAFTLEYPLKNNLSFEALIPFVYEYDKTGAKNSKEVSDFGDVDFGLNYQPFKSGGGFPSIIFRSVLTCPMGRSPYDINPDTELATGSGGYALEGSVSVSKPVDPVMVFGTLGYVYKHPIRNLDYKLQDGSTLERYDRGDSIELSMGLGYALSYKTSLTLGYSYTYTFEAKRYFKEGEPKSYPTRSSGSISIGTSWRISRTLKINMSLGIDITDGHYHSLSFRFPFEYNL
ncbi:MAG: transporter, partial [Desulfobacteraceae bacterium]|nr:transporter [Desulfobacteraceae bacterium]